MKLKEFAEWFKNNPRQSATAIKDALRLSTRSSVASFLSQLEIVEEVGDCPQSGRKSVTLYSFVGFPDKPKPSLSTIMVRRRKENPKPELTDKDTMLIYQETVEPCSFPAMCYACGRNRKHKFERVAVVGRESVVKATCSKCGKETTK